MSYYQMDEGIDDDDGDAANMGDQSPRHHHAFSDDDDDIGMDGDDLLHAGPAVAAPVRLEINRSMRTSLDQFRSDSKSVKTGKGANDTVIPISHTSMIGGKFHTNYITLSGFYSAASVGWLQPTFISEVAVDNHILFFDLDIYVTTDTVWTSQHTLRTVLFFLSKIQQLTDDDDSLQCVITQAEPTLKKGKNGAEDKIKVGIHFYLPLLFVDIPTHVKIRALLLVAAVERSSDHIAVSLDESKGDEDGFLLVNSWGDVLDKAICTKPQLRLYCSSKAEHCDCVPEEGEAKCKGHRINVGRRYNIIDILDVDEDGSFVRDENAYNRFSNLDEPNSYDPNVQGALIQRREEFLKLISLRKTGQLNQITFPDNAAEIEEMAEEFDDDNGPNDEELKTVEVSGEIATIITDLVWMLGLVESPDEITKVSACAAKKGAKPSVYNVALNTHWCFNRCGEHKSNRVYLLVSCLLFLLFLLFLFRCLCFTFGFTVVCFFASAITIATCA